MLSGFLGPRCRPQQLAEMEVAVGGERRTLQLVGQGQALRGSPPLPFRHRADRDARRLSPSRRRLQASWPRSWWRCARLRASSPWRDASSKRPSIRQASPSHASCIARPMPIDAHGRRRSHDFLEKASGPLAGVQRVRTRIRDARARPRAEASRCRPRSRPLKDVRSSASYSPRPSDTAPRPVRASLSVNG